MKEYQSTPDLADAPPDLLDSGHLWIQEQIDGRHLRFRMDESGLLAFGDRARVFDGDVPLPYRHAVRHVRESFDRDALRRATDDVSALVFFGEATVHRRVAYDWDRTPPFLGFDVWSEGDGFLAPDRVERALDRLGLDAVNAVEKEVPARDFHPDRYELPDSRWYDGPAAGVVVRNKNGARATLDGPAVGGGDPDASTLDPAAFADRYVTRDRVASVVARLEERGRAVEFDAVYERVLEELAREEYRRLFDGDEPTVDVGALREAVAARTRDRLDGEG